jgi:hypothetical protein
MRSRMQRLAAPRPGLLFITLLLPSPCVTQGTWYLSMERQCAPRRRNRLQGTKSSIWSNLISLRVPRQRD